MSAIWRIASLMSLLVIFMTGLSVADESSPVDFNARGANETRSESSHEHHEAANATEIQTLPIVLWKWEHVRPPYLLVLWVLVCWLCKLIIRANEKVTSIIPESALLIGFGWILGGIIWGADMAQTFSLPPYTFFYFLLPQIILDAGYSMPNKLMFTNMGAILTYAIIGTCWNAGTVGMALWGCHMGGAMGDIEVSLLQYLLYGSLLSAVDPVAVLAVFEEVHVNEVLFILVFGESLLNDGVTVVLFNVFDAFVSLGAARINAAEIVKGIVSFFVVAFGGSLVGLVFGVLTCLLTRCSKKVQIIEPGFVFLMGYLAYLTADMLSLSAILSITFCGVSCQKYINANMAENSVITVRHAMKVIANGSETIIFIFLGISAIDKTIWVWNTGFILLTVLFVLVFRVIGVFALTWVLNKFRLIPLEIIDQIIMSYGGLRGAVAYGLAVLLDDTKIKEKNLMLGTTLIVVYFTVIIQGVTLKPLVTWLKVKRAALTELTLIEKVQNKVFDHMLVGIEDISGQIGHNYFRDKWYKFEDKWMTKVLMSTSARKNRDRFYNIYHQLNLKDATSYVAEAERRGSLDFFHNETAIVDFQKKFDNDYVEIMPDLMASDHMPVSSILRDNVPSVSLEMHERDREGMRETEDINTHHLLEEHLYKSRKQHRHRYSRNHFDINKDENEVQEIFQRTMRTRLESFKSAKMGVAPPNKMTKHSKKAQQLKMPNGKSMNINGNQSFCEEDLSGGEGASSSDASGNSYQMIATYRAGAGIVNPAFMPEMDPTPPINVSPWLTNAGTDRTTVVPGNRQHQAHPHFRTQPDPLDTPASQGSKSNQPPSNHNKLPTS